MTERTNVWIFKKYLELSHARTTPEDVYFEMKMVIDEAWTIRISEVIVGRTLMRDSMEKNFSEVLAEYMRELDLTESELAEKCGISNASISRFLHGERVPYKDSQILDRLATAVFDFCGEGDSKKTIKQRLSYGLREHQTYPDLSKKFDMLTCVHRIKISDLASSMYFDASYLSRIRQGLRTPRNQDAFIDGLAQYTVQHRNQPADLKTSAKLLGCSPEDLCDPAEYEKRITDWLRTAIPTVDGVQAADDMLLPHHKKMKTMELRNIELDVRDDENRNRLYHISGRLKITVTEYPSK